MTRIKTHQPTEISDPFITINHDNKVVELMVCHRRPERSLIIGGKPILCWRCFGTYATFLGIILYQFVGLIIGFGGMFEPVRYWWLLLTGGNLLHELGLILLLHLPMIIDGTIQAKFSYESGTKRRLLTGILAGIGQVAIYLLIGSLVMLII